MNHDPIHRPCPVCRADAGEPCRSRPYAWHRDQQGLRRVTEGEIRSPHRVRVAGPSGVPRRARDVPCPVCRAAAGQPCRRIDGRPLPPGRAHAERNRAFHEEVPHA